MTSKEALILLNLMIYDEEKVISLFDKESVEKVKEKYYG